VQLAAVRSREHPAEDSERRTRRGGDTFAEERREVTPQRSGLSARLKGSGPHRREPPPLLRGRVTAVVPGGGVWMRERGRGREGESAGEGAPAARSREFRKPDRPY